MSARPATTALPRRYEVVADALRRNLVEGRVPAGTVLLEGPIADLFRLSRAPVQRALQQLEDEGLIHRFDGRGYLAGDAQRPVPRRRIDLTSLDLVLPTEAEEGFGERQTWRQIYARVEADITRCLVFGRYRVVETELAEHFDVSRTIVRDVLGRLQERGLVGKNDSSHWIAGPLTARSIKDQFELRRILEPPALLSAAGVVDRATLGELVERLRAAEQGDGSGDETAHAVSDLFVEAAILTTPNLSLRDLVRRNLHTVLVSQGVLRQLGLPADRTPLSEQRLIAELLLRGAAEAASAMLVTHIEAELRRTVARMKIVAVVPQPISLAPYLRPADPSSDAA